MPAPTQTIIIGPSAIFGNAFNTTIYGSRMRERVLLHHISTAISVPTNVPTVNPAIVSNIVTPI